MLHVFFWMILCLHIAARKKHLPGGANYSAGQLIIGLFLQLCAKYDTLISYRKGCYHELSAIE